MRAASAPPIDWPDGKRFAFTVFDDPDAQSLPVGREVYAFLADLGFRTTKGVWPLGRTVPGADENDEGGDCSDAEYREWVVGLQSQGFEIGWHNATAHTSPRERTREGLDRFREYFGHDPATMANHYNADEGIYFGEARVSGLPRLIYTLATRGANRGRYRGEREGDPLFWGDLCRERVRYVRNFVFPETNTLALCPEMPYHDPARPYVNAWYASSEGDKRPSFVERISEARIDQLEEEGGACVMYTHFGHGFVEDGRLHPRFRTLMERIAEKDGWFVPVGTLLDFLAERKGGVHTLTGSERRRLERRWIRHKLRFGTA